MKLTLIFFQVSAFILALASTSVRGGVIGDYGGQGEGHGSYEGQGESHGSYEGQSEGHGGYEGQGQNLESGGEYGGSDQGSYEGGDDLSNHISEGEDHSANLSHEGLAAALQEGYGQEQGGG